MIDREIALSLPFEPIVVEVERGRLQFFAKAIGETNPIYLDVNAALDAGHNDLPVPPTFFFSLELASPHPFFYLDTLGIDLRQILHGGQSFSYEALVHAGDTITLRSKIVDVYEKKGGVLEFIVNVPMSCVVKGG